MSENRKTFRLTPEAQTVLDNVRESKRTYKGSSYNSVTRRYEDQFRMPTENEVLNLIIDEFPRVAYLEKQLQEAKSKIENLQERLDQENEKWSVLRGAIFPGLEMDFFKKVQKQLAENAISIQRLTAKLESSAPDPDPAPAESDSKKGKKPGARSAKKTAIEKEIEELLNS